MKVWVFHLAMICFTISTFYFIAENGNNAFFVDEEKYILPKKRKVSSWLRRKTKNRPLKFTVYWALRFTEIMLVLDLLVILSARLHTKSFAFMGTLPFAVYTISLYFLPDFLLGGVNLYIKIKKAEEHKKKQKMLQFWEWF